MNVIQPQAHSHDGCGASGAESETESAIAIIVAVGEIGGAFNFKRRLLWGWSGEI